MSSFSKDLNKILKFEPYVFGLFCLAVVLHFARLSFAEPLLTISASTLTMFYLFKAFLKKENLGTFSIVLRIATLFTIAFGLLSLLFLFLKWPGAYNVGIVFLLAFMLIAVIVVVKQVEYTKIITKLDALLLFGLFIMILGGNFSHF